MGGEVEICMYIMGAWGLYDYSFQLDFCCFVRNVHEKWCVLFVGSFFFLYLCILVTLFFFGPIAVAFVFDYFGDQFLTFINNFAVHTS